MFKVGDKVICIDPRDYLALNGEYIIDRVIDNMVYIKTKEPYNGFFAERFKLVEEIDDSLDKLRNIRFDSDFEPNISSVTDVGGIMALNEHLAKEAFKLGSKDDKVLEIIRGLI